MPSLQTSIRALAESFVQSVLRTLSSASLAELAALGGKRSAVALALEGKRRGQAAAKTPGRRIRRSSEDVAELAQSVAYFVKRQPNGVAVSDIARALGLPTSDVNRPVAIALAEGKIKKTGQKRLTRYHAADGVKAATKRRAKKG